MKLILVRHGESARNRGYMVKSEENNLTTTGVEQMIKTAQTLAQQKIDVIYCSPTNRCEQSLEEILRVKDDNQPVYMCQLVGPKRRKEKFEEVKRRIERFVDDLKNDHQDSETILIIGHKISLGMISLVISGVKKELENGDVLEMYIEN